MWPVPLGESDVSQIWQDSLGSSLSQEADGKKHMHGTTARHLIRRHFLILPTLGSEHLCSGLGYREALR